MLVYLIVKIHALEHLEHAVFDILEKILQRVSLLLIQFGKESKVIIHIHLLVFQTRKKWIFVKFLPCLVSAAQPKLVFYLVLHISKEQLTLTLGVPAALVLDISRISTVRHNASKRRLLCIAPQESSAATFSLRIFTVSKVFNDIGSAIFLGENAVE